MLLKLLFISKQTFIQMEKYLENYSYSRYRQTFLCSFARSFLTTNQNRNIMSVYTRM